MARKFHVNGRGEAGLCKAEKGFCPFGDDENHFESKTEARQAYEAAQGTALFPEKSGGEVEHIIADTNWDYDEAPKTQPDWTPEHHPYLDVNFGRNMNTNKLRLVGPEPAVRAYLAKLDEVDTERLTHLTSIHHANPKVIAKESKAAQRFRTEWEERGFSRFEDLPTHERNMANYHYRYSNEAAIRYHDDSGKMARIEPLTDLARYAPHMQGNGGTWIETKLTFDHSTGNFYGVTTVDGYASKLRSKSVQAVQVADYGQDFEAALRGVQEQSDSAITSFLGAHPSARLSAKARDDFSAAPSSMLDSQPQDFAFTNHREAIRKELVKGVEDAMLWNRKKREVENLTPEDEARLTAAGY